MRIALAVTLCLAISGPAFAAESVDKAPPPAPFEKVSKLVKLPDFLPGLGELYVDPKTLPAGPFLAYDHDGKIVSTVYMTRLPISKPRKISTTCRLPAGRWTTWMFTSMLVTQASKFRMLISSSGTFRLRTRLASRSELFSSMVLQVSGFHVSGTAIRCCEGRAFRYLMKGMRMALTSVSLGR